MSRFASLLAAVFGVLLAGCGPSSPLTVQAGAGSQLRAGLLDYEVALSHGTVTTGRLTVVVTNAGAQAHDLRIDGAETTLATTVLLRPGESTEVSLEIGRGETELVVWCTLPGHRAQGMAATIPVVEA